jgi:hypothetical protein
MTIKRINIALILPGVLHNYKVWNPYSSQAGNRGRPKSAVLDCLIKRGLLLVLGSGAVSESQSGSITIRIFFSNVHADPRLRQRPRFRFRFRRASTVNRSHDHRPGGLVLSALDHSFWILLLPSRFAMYHRCSVEMGKAGGDVNFEKVMKEVGGFFKKEKYPFAVIGAFALHAYGLTRVTSDLDFVTDVRAQEKLISFLEQLGYETLYMSAGYSNHLHTDIAMGRLDFVYVSGETSSQLLGSTTKSFVLGGMPVVVPRAEHIVAMKIQAMKNDPERFFQDMADIQFLMQLPDVDRSEIKEYFEKQGLLDKYYGIQRIIDSSESES